MSYQPVTVNKTPEDIVSAEVPAARKPWLNNLTEDWWAVLIGGFIIAVIVLIVVLSNGFTFNLPVYQWAGGEDLFGKVLSLV